MSQEIASTTPSAPAVDRAALLLGAWQRILRHNAQKGRRYKFKRPNWGALENGVTWLSLRSNNIHYNWIVTDVAVSSRSGKQAVIPWVYEDGPAWARAESPFPHDGHLPADLTAEDFAVFGADLTVFFE